MLTYPGQRDLREAESLSKSASEAASTGGGAGDDAFVDTAIGCATSCCCATERGLGLADRTEALQLWSQAIEALAGKLDDGKWLHLAVASDLLNQFNKSGLLEVVALLDAQDLDRTCVAIDWLTANVVAQHEDAPAACRIADDLIGKLPLLPDVTVGQRVLRGNFQREPSYIYSLAQRIVDDAVDAPRIASAAGITNLDYLLREHHRETMTSADRARLAEMEQIDQGLDQQFGDLWVHGYQSGVKAAVGTVLRALSAEARAEKSAVKEECDQRKSQVHSAAGMFGKHAYIAAFATYLDARIDAAFDRVSAAITGYREALEKGFDPHITVAQLAFILTFRNKADEARVVLEHWIPRLYLDRVADDPDKSVSDLTDLYVKAGGRKENLCEGYSLPEFSQKAGVNKKRRSHLAAESASKAKERAAALLDRFGRKGLTLIDSLLRPCHYDAALGGEHVDEVVRLDPSAAARLCLDETPLFDEAGLESLVKLASDGLPGTNAGTYGLGLAACAEKRHSFSWQQLHEACPNMFRSAFYGEKRTRAALDGGDLTLTRDLLVHFANGRVLAAERVLALYETLVERYRGGGDLESVASLGEVLHGNLAGDPSLVVRRRTVETLLKLAEAADSAGKRIGYLERALTVDPTDQEVAGRLSSAQKARFKRNLIIAAVVCGVVAIAILVACLV